MYLSFFNLRREPFGITPDPRFLYLSSVHKEALAAVIYGVNQRKGFVSIIGEVGTGKTTILRAFLERVNPARLKAIYIFNSLESFPRILDEILPSSSNRYVPRDRIRELHEWLISEYREGRNVVVIIDEAQRLPLETLEKLRLLSNLETKEQKLIQIVLAGQPELDRKLGQRTLRQLKQRIAVRATIGPLTKAESLAYVNHRLSTVSIALAPVFTRAALSHIVRHAKGNPRVLNILCDNALVAGYGYQKKPVSARITREVIADYTGMPKQHLSRLKHVLSLVIAIIVGVVLASQIPAGALSTLAVRAGINRLDSSIQFLSSWTTQDAVTVATQRLVAAGIHSIHSRAGSADHSAILVLESRYATQDMKWTDETVSSGVDGVRTDAIDHPLGKRGAVLRTDFPISLVVRKGDDLWQLCRDVYGFANMQLVEQIVTNNPHLKDAGALSVGDKLTFPELSRMDKQISLSSARDPKK